MRFVLALHSHLPWVLHHGRWPHGSDWLCEAAVDTYLPLIAACEALAEQGVRAPITLGVTPILANQLAHPSFRTELDAFLAQRLDACEEAIATFRQTGERRRRLEIAGGIADEPDIGLACGDQVRFGGFEVALGDREARS